LGVGERISVNLGLIFCTFFSVESDFPTILSYNAIVLYFEVRFFMTTFFIALKKYFLKQLFSQLHTMTMQIKFLTTALQCINS
jgi:hypothetical protein